MDKYCHKTLIIYGSPTVSELIVSLIDLPQSISFSVGVSFSIVITPSNHVCEAALHVIGNPVQCCVKVYKLVCNLVEIVRSKRDDPKTKSLTYLKIPDIYDCIKYDIQHNQAAQKFNHAQELYIIVKALADILIPQEYGLSDQDKLAIGPGICNPSLRKIPADLQRNIEEDLRA
ncbi:hypothetical protein DAPPUDRAFT_315386 [Daphnia pulex]|uniref:Uncharacterized protein n=1 Tax=Daphnia pulex TaxID=6669 RepID=E9G9K9_DAPPU|nr:hypothetical protein DAPPUDRAFT_315386 [Daphnia pulex]|eukprot:EFX83862.1 hypothetical protein DAPPUDRAFT_315386 [Daphnia pulex]